MTGHHVIASTPRRAQASSSPKPCGTHGRSPATRLDNDEHGARLTGVMADSVYMGRPRPRTVSRTCPARGARSRLGSRMRRSRASQPNHGVSDPANGARVTNALTGGVAHAMVWVLSAIAMGN